MGYTKVTDMITEVYRFQLKTLRRHTLVITETVDHDSIFICRKCNRCQRTLSVRGDSFFSGSRISLGRHVHFLWKWSQKDSLKIMETEGVASRKILVKFSRKCREVAWDALLRHPIPQLGGPGVTVQIDESKFNHKSKVSKCIKTGMEKSEMDWK